MPWETKYRSKWTGEIVTHVNTNDEADARAWGRMLAQENGCKAVTEFVHSGPHTDNSGRRTHIESVGNDKE